MVAAPTTKPPCTVNRISEPVDQPRFWLDAFREDLGALPAQSLTPGPSSGVPKNSTPAAGVSQRTASVWSSVQR